MTVWDSMAINAPHTLREMAQDGDNAPGSTTGPENAQRPSVGASGACREHDKSCHLRSALDAIAAEKATWPHAGSMHDGARKACDNIATRIKQLMGDA